MSSECQICPKCYNSCDENGTPRQTISCHKIQIVCYYNDCDLNKIFKKSNIIAFDVNLKMTGI